MNNVITPSMTNLFFHIILICIGLDFIWNGYWFLKKNTIPRFPKLLGYLVFKLVEMSKRKNVSKIGIVNALFGMKAASIYMVIGGSLIIIISILELLFLN